MCPGGWLNDTIMYVVVLLIQERLRKRSSGCGSRTHVFNTYFFEKLCPKPGDYHFEDVKQWTNPSKLLGAPVISLDRLDRIVIPINRSNSHWIVAVISFSQKAIHIYDSLRAAVFPEGYGPIFSNLKRWIGDESLSRTPMNPIIDAAAWAEVVADVPQQTNGNDCGMFSILFMDYITRDIPFDFTDADINRQRFMYLYKVLRMDMD